MENYPQYANWVSLAFSHLVEHKNIESKNPENLGRPIGYRVLRNDWRTYSSDSCQEMPELTLSDYELFWPFRTHLSQITGNLQNFAHTLIAHSFLCCMNRFC